MTIDGFLSSNPAVKAQKKAGLWGSGFLLSFGAAHAWVGQPAGSEIKDMDEMPQVDATADSEIIQAVYLRLALLHHPD